MPSGYDIKKNPRHQRALSSLLARQSMGGRGRRVGSVLQGGLNAKAAGNQYARQLEFERLALQKKASLAAEGHTSRMMGLREKSLKDEEKMMGLTTALGIGMTGVNYLVGKQRADILAEDRAETKEWRKNYLRQGSENASLIKLLRSRKPIGNSTYLQGGL